MYIIENANGVQYLNTLITTASATQTALQLGTATADPSDNIAGGIYFNSSTQEVRIYNTSGWVNFSSWKDSGTFIGTNGIEYQNNGSADITGQTLTAGFTYLEQDIIQSGRLATGDVEFINLKLDGTSVFKIQENGLAEYGSSLLGSFTPNSLASIEYVDYAISGLDAKE